MEDERAGEGEHINEAVFDYIREQAAHPCGDERAGGGDVNGRAVAEHVEPDAMRFGELARAETGAFHFLKQPGDGTVAVNLDRARGGG